MTNGPESKARAASVSWAGAAHFRRNAERTPSRTALPSRFYMVKRTHVLAIAPAAPEAEFLPVRAAWRGQDRLGARAVPGRAVLRPARSPDVHTVAGRAEKPAPAPPGSVPEGMVWIPGGEFRMGQTKRSSPMRGRGTAFLSTASRSTRPRIAPTKSELIRNATLAGLAGFA